MPDDEKILEALKRIEGELRALKELRTLRELAILWTLVAVVIVLWPILGPILWTLLLRFKH